MDFPGSPLTPFWPGRPLGPAVPRDQGDLALRDLLSNPSVLEILLVRVYQEVLLALVSPGGLVFPVVQCSLLVLIGKLLHL